MKNDAIIQHLLNYLLSFYAKHLINLNELNVNVNWHMVWSRLYLRLIYEITETVYEHRSI